MIKHILFPSDGSRLSENAARFAVDLAKAAGARITVFHVKEDRPASYAAEGTMFDALLPAQLARAAESREREIFAFVEELCQKAGVICTKLTRIDGVVFQEIIDVATKNDCDLIVMASHGRRGIGALILGSETNKVLIHSKIPVLVHR